MTVTYDKGLFDGEPVIDKAFMRLIRSRCDDLWCGGTLKYEIQSKSGRSSSMTLLLLAEILDLTQ